MTVAAAGKNHRAVTLKVVAEHAQCSIAQVSAVLNHSQGGTVVSQAKREKIQKIADELGYRPNFASQALKKNRTRTIGIYLPGSPWRSLGNAYELAIYRGIEAAATKLDYDLLIFNLLSDVSPLVCERKLEESRCDGVILIKVGKQTDWIERLVKRNRHLVAIEGSSMIPGLSRIAFNEEAAMRLAVTKLREKGHTRIGFLGLGLELEEDMPRRNELFARCIRDLGCDTDDELIFDCGKCSEKLDISMEFCQLSGKYGIRYFKNLVNPPTALISFDSLVALAALQEAHQCGVRIPEDMSIVGFDDYDFVSFFSPKLTVIDHGLHEMGEKAAQLLIAKIEGQDDIPIQEVVEPGWIERETVLKKQ